MVFMLTGGDIVRRRNKRNEICIDDKIDYDQQVINDHVEKVGCKPPYLNVRKNYSVCSTRDELHRAVFDAYFVRDTLKKPCTSLENMNFRYQVLEYQFSTENHTTLFL